MISYSYYPSDTRIRKEAETLVNNFYDVDILCLKRKGEFTSEVFNNVKIYRIGIEKIRRGIFNYLILYSLFFLAVFFKINFLYARKKYTFFHFHNMPNFLVFSAIIPKIFGSKIILDMHDPMPELLNSALKTNNRLLKKILILEEKLSIKFVHKVITTNNAFKEVFISRGCPSDKIEIVMNSPQNDIFDKIKPVKRNDGKFVILYNGSIVERHGLDILIDAIFILKDKIPNLELRIFGTGEFWDLVSRKIGELNLWNYVKYYGGVMLDDLVKEIATCDLGIIPNRFNEFTNLNFPIRVLEYIHFKKPVIVPRTKGIIDYFPENSIFYFDPLRANELSKIIFNIYINKESLRNIIEEGYKIYQRNTWQQQKEVLLKLYALT